MCPILSIILRHTMRCAFNDSLEIDREGRLPAPERPGIGFEPDYSVLDRFRII